MRFTSFAFFAGLIAIGSAQAPDFNNLPNCAKACVGSNLGGCPQLDYKCVCSNSNLISNLSCCVSTSCSPDDQQKTIQFATQLCKIQGIDLPTVASCATGASSTGTAAASGSASATSAASQASSVASGASSAAAAAATRNAAAHNMGSDVGLGMAIAGMLAAL